MEFQNTIQTAVTFNGKTYKVSEMVVPGGLNEIKYQKVNFNGKPKGNLKASEIYSMAMRAKNKASEKGDSRDL